MYEVKSLFLGMVSVSSLIRLSRDVGCLSHAHASSNYVRMLHHASCHICCHHYGPQNPFTYQIAHAVSLYCFVVITAVIIMLYTSHFAIFVYTYKFKNSDMSLSTVMYVLKQYSEHSDILLFFSSNFVSVLCSLFYLFINLSPLKPCDYVPPGCKLKNYTFLSVGMELRKNTYYIPVLYSREKIMFTARYGLTL